MSKSMRNPTVTVVVLMALALGLLGPARIGRFFVSVKDGVCGLFDRTRSIEELAKDAMEDLDLQIEGRVSLENKARANQGRIEKVQEKRQPLVDQQAALRQDVEKLRSKLSSTGDNILYINSRPFARVDLEEVEIDLREKNIAALDDSIAKADAELAGLRKVEKEFLATIAEMKKDEIGLRDRILRAQHEAEIQTVRADIARSRNQMKPVSNPALAELERRGSVSKAIVEVIDGTTPALTPALTPGSTPGSATYKISSNDLHSN